MRQQFESRRRQLDADLVFHAEHLAPRLAEVTSRRRQFACALQPFLKDKRLKAADRQVVGDLLGEHLSEIPIGHGPEDEDLRAIFEQLHGEDYASVADAQMEEARGELEGLFSEMGFDVDLSGIREDMTEEELAAKMAELFAGVQRQAQAAHAGRARAATTKRELREQARRAQLDEARRNSVGTVYRRLAKALHPDLEPDPRQRERKSRIMQEVTSAHAANDLHALLRLELAWMQTEEHDITRLTDEKLRAYNQLLKEQVRELEGALHMLPAHPRYEPLTVVADGPFGFGGLMDVRAEAARLDALRLAFDQVLELLAAPDALDHVRQIVRSRSAQPRQLETWIIDDSPGRRRERPRRRQRSPTRR